MEEVSRRLGLSLRASLSICLTLKQVPSNHNVKHLCRKIPFKQGLDESVHTQYEGTLHRPSGDVEARAWPGAHTSYSKDSKYRFLHTPHMIGRGGLGSSRGCRLITSTLRAFSPVGRNSQESNRDPHHVQRRLQVFRLYHPSFSNSRRHISQVSKANST